MCYIGTYIDMIEKYKENDKELYTQIGWVENLTDKDKAQNIFDIWYNEYYLK